MGERGIDQVKLTFLGCIEVYELWPAKFKTMKWEWNVYHLYIHFCYSKKYMYIVLIINKMYFFFTNNSLLQSAKMYIVAINKKNPKTKQNQ